MLEGTRTFDELLNDFLEHGRVLNYSPRTLQDYAIQLKHFFLWLENHFDIRTADRLSNHHLETWLRHFTTRRTPQGLPLKTKTIRLRVAVLRSFLKYLAQQGYLRKDLPDLLISPKDEQMLPANVLVHAQVRKLLARVDTTNPIGYRDRVILGRPLRYLRGGMLVCKGKHTELLKLAMDLEPMEVGSGKLVEVGRPELR